MVGFGAGPFGNSPFGEAFWVRRILWDYLPEIHRVQDEAQGYPLRLFMDSLRPMFDGLRQKMQDFSTLRDPLAVPSQYTGVSRLRLGSPIPNTNPVEQRNLDGVVLVGGNFKATRARFTDNLIGHEITIRGSNTASNNRVVTISKIVSRQEVVTTPLLTVSPADRGLRWELRAPPPEVQTVTVEVQEGDISLLAPGWVISDGQGQFEVVARRRFHPLSAERKFLTEQEGSDGTIDNTGKFRSSTIVLTQADVGKTLTVPDPNDDTTVSPSTILAVETSGSIFIVTLDRTLAQNSEEFAWALLPRAEVDLRGSALPRGTVDQFNFDGELDPDASLATNVFRAVSGSFADGDVGKFLYLRGSGATPRNDGPFKILAVLSPQRLQLDAIFTVPDAHTGALYWEVRSATALGDLTQVDAGPPSLLEFLAGDFGVRLDRQESDARQRSWVRNSFQWNSIKGLAKAYATVGKVAGFDVTTSQLFRIDQDLTNQIPAVNVIEIGDAGAGRVGADGSLTLGAGRVRFSSPTLAVTKADIGRQIRVGNSGSANNGLRTIDRYVSANTVEFRLADTATVPDASNGTLTWSVVRLYTTLAPLIPNFDEIDAELMESVANTEFISHGVVVGTFNAGDTITGGTSGATAIVVADAAGVLRVADVRGTFVNAETVTGVISGSAAITLVGDGKSFSIDRFCWEANFVTEVPIHVVSVASAFPDPDVYDVIIEGPGNVVGDVGNWKLVDKNGKVFFVESVPVGKVTYASKTASFEVGSTLYAPLKLDYDGAAGAFVPGNTLTGATSGATAKIVSDANAGATGTLKLTNVNGTFIDDEAIADGGGTALVNGLIQVQAHAKITAVQVLTGTTGILTLSDIFGTFRSGDPLFSITDANGNWIPDLGTSNGKATASTRTRFTFQTRVSVPPAASTGALWDTLLRYDCPLNIVCGYCPARTIFVEIAEGTIAAETGDALEQAFERVLRRIEDEVKPAHVDLAVRYTGDISASLFLGATVEIP